MAQQGVTKEERERRLSIVEQAIHDHGWSMRLEAALAQRIGVTTRTIRKYREDIEARCRKELDRDRRMLRASLLVRIHGHQRAARQAQRFGPLASMLALEARMTGVLEPEEAPVPDNLEALDREELLREIARDLTLDDLSVLQRLREGGL